MEWMAPASAIAMCPIGRCEHHQCREPSMDEMITIGVDLAKSVFQLHGLLKKSFQADAGIGLASRISMTEHSKRITAVASFFRFMAMAVRRAWIFMFSSPLRMALASPWSVFAVPCAPSTRHRCRGVDRVVVFTPCRAFAPGAQDGRVVGDDMHPAGRRALGQALRLERAARAVAPVSVIPSAGFRAVAGGKPLLRRTSDHIVVRIILEPLGWKALRPLAAGGPKRRDDGFDLALFKGGVHPGSVMNSVYLAWPMRVSDTVTR